MLIHLDNEFLQLLEGEKDQVMTTFNRIALDERHSHVVILGEGPIERRNFEDWDMGFHILSVKEFQAKTGFKDLATYLKKEKYHDLSMLIFLLKEFAQLFSNNK